MPELPDAIQAYNRLRALMLTWMTVSILMIILSPYLLFISLPIGILGVVASSLHICENCRSKASIVGSVVTIKVLAAVVATLEFILAGVLLLVAIVAAENNVIGYLVILTLVYGLHGVLSLFIFIKMQHINSLLNPIQSGMVVL